MLDPISPTLAPSIDRQTYSSGAASGAAAGLVRVVVGELEEPGMLARSYSTETWQDHRLNYQLKPVPKHIEHARYTPTFADTPPRKRRAGRLPLGEARPAGPALVPVGRPTRCECVFAKLRAKDVYAIKAFQDTHLPISYPASFYSLLLSSAESVCLVARAPSSDPAQPPSGPLLGCIAARTVPASTSCLASGNDPEPIPTVYLLCLAVDPSARKCGLATRMMAEAMRELLPVQGAGCDATRRRCKVVLHVSKTNAAARRAYEKWGLVGGRESRCHYVRLSGDAGVAVEYTGELELPA